MTRFTEYSKTLITPFKRSDRLELVMKWSKTIGIDHEDLLDDIINGNPEEIMAPGNHFKTLGHIIPFESIGLVGKAVIFGDLPRLESSSLVFVLGLNDGVHKYPIVLSSVQFLLFCQSILDVVQQAQMEYCVQHVGSTEILPFGQELEDALRQGLCDRLVQVRGHLTRLNH